MVKCIKSSNTYICNKTLQMQNHAESDAIKDIHAKIEERKNKEQHQQQQQQQQQQHQHASYEIRDPYGILNIITTMTSSMRSRL